MSQSEHIFQLFPEIKNIKEGGLREQVIGAWLMALQESQWTHIEDLPWVPGRAGFISNVQHCRGVARIGAAIGRTILEGKDIAPGVTIDLDVIIASCLLHDVGKLLEYAAPPNPPGEKTALGGFMKHHILGAHIAIKAGLRAEVVHCIESHLEPETFERSFEAKVVHWSDVLHAEAILRANPGVSIF